jgi:type I site-specific restriction endonuclease
VTRGKAKRADYVLYYKPNIPIAIFEAKDNNCSMGDGIQQALDYAVTLDIEPHRESRRLQQMRRWSHDEREDEKLFA